MTKSEIFDSIKSWLLRTIDDQESLFLNKEKMTQKKINELNSVFSSKFLAEREQYRTLVKQDIDLYQMFWSQCKKSFLFWLLWDSHIKDQQRNGKADKQAFIPYKYQIPLINELQFGEKNILIEKSRRTSASTTNLMHMTWNLLFGVNTNSFTTHKSLDSLDIKSDYVQTTFGRIRFALKHSMFVPFSRFNLISKSPFDESNEFKIEEKRIVFYKNLLDGFVLSPDTSVGMAYETGYLDEVAVVEDKYKNSTSDLLGFASSTNRLIMYSTHRGIETNFYKIAKMQDTSKWTYFRLHYSMHPLINKEWVEEVKSKMGYDRVLIARELEINPEESVSGIIFYHITDKNKVNRSKMSDWIQYGKKYIFSDQFAGTSKGSLVFAYYYKGVIYLDSAYKQARIDEYMIKSEIDKRGFTNIPVHMDVAGGSVTQSIGRDWVSLLRNVGITVITVSNNNVFEWRSITNYAFYKGEILYNKDDSNFNDLLAYRYKNTGEVDKGEASAIGDAVIYGYKTVFPKSTIGFIDTDY